MMSQYTTNTSDKKKKKALLFWAIGCIGILGFEYFYVGRIKNGIIRLIIGVFILLSFSAMQGTDSAFPVTFIFWAIAALPNLFRIFFGVFRDNTNVALRE